MPEVVSVRLDDETLRALRRLEATDISRSEAIRRALLEAAARLESLEELAREAAALEADDEDREEMLAAAELMGSLCAPW